MVVDNLQLGLDSLILGLGLVLGAIAFAAARTYHERRFALVGLAVMGLGAVGAAGLVGLFGTSGWVGFSLGDVPAVLLLASEALLYLSLYSSRAREAPMEVAGVARVVHP